MPLSFRFAAWAAEQFGDTGGMLGKLGGLAREYAANYFLTVTDHYELMQDHFAKTRGYEHYASSTELFKQVGVETAAKGYCQVNCWGSPEQILEKLRHRWELLGGFELGDALVKLAEEGVDLGGDGSLLDKRW